MKKTIAILAAILMCALCFAAAAEGTKAADFTKVGNIVTFRRYEQDNDTKNGPEAIQWIVLDYDEEGHRSLLVSKYGLDTIPFNKNGFNYATWENCKLRIWLNQDFLESAFSEQERTAILMTAVDNSPEQGYDWLNKWIAEGKPINVNDTEDQLFLLSYAEANRYFGVTYEDKNNIQARLAPTAYARARGAGLNKRYKTADGETPAIWWLRSPGGNPMYAAVVCCDGSLSSYHVRDPHHYLLVRPAFWLDLEADIF